MTYHRAAGRYMLVVGIILCIGVFVGFVYGLLHDALIIDIGPFLMILAGSGIYNGSNGWRKFGIVVCIIYVIAGAALFFVAIFSPGSLSLKFGGTPVEINPSVLRTLALIFSLLYIVLFGIPLYLLLHPGVRRELQP